MISSLRSNTSLSKASSQRRHLVLSLGDAMQPFPWESMPFLLQQSISRVPSIHFFKHMKSNCPKGMRGLKEGIDIGSTCYILNPGGDLTRTQTLFEPIFSS
jgi:separase